jgi:stringent starvation protein B
MNTANDKRERLEQLLELGMVMVHLDARTKGVNVPKSHATNPALALNLSLRFNIPDFRMDDDGIFASLSFARSPYPCMLPWDAIFAVRSHVDDTFHVWPEDVPSELVEHARAQLDAQISNRKDEEGPADLRLTKIDLSGSDDSSHREADGSTSVPYLRVVK